MASLDTSTGGRVLSKSGGIGVVIEVGSASLMDALLGSWTKRREPRTKGAGPDCASAEGRTLWQKPSNARRQIQTTRATLAASVEGAVQ